MESPRMKIEFPVASTDSLTFTNALYAIYIELLPDMSSELKREIIAATNTVFMAMDLHPGIITARAWDENLEPSSSAGMEMP